MPITNVDPLPSLSRADPDFRGEVNNFFDTLLPNFTVQSNQQALDIAAVGSQVTADKNAAANSVTVAAHADLFQRIEILGHEDKVHYLSCVGAINSTIEAFD